MKPFHNHQWRQNARFQDCTLRLDGCPGDPATVVLCHVRMPGDGMATKPSDWWACFGCAHCHALLDAHRADWRDIARAIRETFQIQLETSAAALASFYAPEVVQ